MKRGEIWLSELPLAEGREQRGTRPQIIVAINRAGIVTSIPLTSNEEAQRFSNTLFIKRTTQNNLTKDSVALIFHIKSVDERRFIKRIGELDERDFKRIKKELMSYLGL